MADEIKTRVTILADEAMRALREITKLEGDVGDAAEEAGKQTKTASVQNDLMAKGVGLLKGEVIGLIGAMSGGFGLVALWQEYERALELVNERLKENAKLTRAAAEARLDLAALKGFESKEDVAFIGQAAQMAGRDPGEVARTMTIIGGAIGPEKTQQIQALTMQVAAKAQQTTTPMTQLAGPFIQLFKQTGDARVAANILEGAIDAAEEPDPGKVGEQVAKMLGSRAISGLGVGESAGYAAATTGLGISSEVASTALNRLVLGLRGAGTPEGNEIMEREGIDRENFTPGLRQILKAAREGRITRQELESIGGKEGLPVLSALVNEGTENQFFARVNAVKGAETMDGMLLSAKSKGIFGSDLQKYNLMAKQVEADTANTRGTDEAAAKAAAVRSLLQNILTKGVQSGLTDDAQAAKKLESYDTAIARGMDPVAAAEYVEHAATFWSGGRGRSGPELGAAAYDFLQAGPNLDPSVVRDFQAIPAGGMEYELDEFNPKNRQHLSPAPTIIINNNIGVMNGKPAAETNAKRKEQE